MPARIAGDHLMTREITPAEKLCGETGAVNGERSYADEWMIARPPAGEPLALS